MQGLMSEGSSADRSAGVHEECLVLTTRDRPTFLPKLRDGCDGWAWLMSRELIRFSSSRDREVWTVRQQSKTEAGE